MSDHLQSIENILSNLPDGSHVAVITMLGSLCPITRSHVQCYVEARHIVLDHPEAKVPRPQRLQAFDECIGLVSLNGDGFVGPKLMHKGQKPINFSDRRHLVELATDEYPWLSYAERNFCTLRELQQRFPSLHFTEIDMNGADDVVKYQKWHDGHRMIVMGRPGSTQGVIKGMRDCGIDVDDGKCILGPELEDISSTAAREASMKGDRDALLKMLHPGVADWMLARDCPGIVDKHCGSNAMENQHHDLRGLNEQQDLPYANAQDQV
jgi:hypothetical protein